MDSQRRRLLLAFGTATAGGLAGCSGGSNSGGTSTGTNTPAPTTGTESGTEGETPPDPPIEQTATLRADESDATDVFGAAVELSGDGSTAAVGSLGEDLPTGGWEAPSVYVFSLSDG